MPGYKPAQAGIGVSSSQLCYQAVYATQQSLLLTPPAHTFVPVDAPALPVLVCDYTGKEVVECKVQMVVVAKDQVRWLRLRAVALSGASRARRKARRDAKARTHPVS